MFLYKMFLLSRKTFFMPSINSEQGKVLVLKAYGTLAAIQHMAASVGAK